METIEELQKQLTKIDLDSIRSIRALFTGTYTKDDEKFLMKQEHKAEILRARIQQLKGKNL